MCGFVPKHLLQELGKLLLQLRCAELININGGGRIPRRPQTLAELSVYRFRRV